MSNDRSPVTQFPMILKEDPAEIRIAVESAFPGLRCSAITASSYLGLTVSGPEALLLKHEFISQSMVKALPPCGVHRFDESAILDHGRSCWVDLRKRRDGFAAGCLWYLR